MKSWRGQLRRSAVWGFRTALKLAAWSAAIPNAMSAPVPPSYDVCPGWTIVGPNDLNLTDVELRLFCGDPVENPKHPNDAWKLIPYSQAKIYLNNFLQERGFHHAQFRRERLAASDPEQLRAPPVLGKERKGPQGETLNAEGFHVVVTLGEPTRIREIRLTGADVEIEFFRRRKLFGDRLSSVNLNLIERWTLERLSELGYACSKLAVYADVDRGEVTVQFLQGGIKTLSSVEQEDIVGVRPGILRRYDAFRLGDRYNGLLVPITENRVKGANLVESSRITTHCEGDEVTLRQSALAGAPRLVTVGGGIDTEGVVRVKATWENTRLSNEASLLLFSAEASARVQRIRANMNWYVLPEVSRFYLAPNLMLNRLNFQQYDTVTASASFGAASRYDWFTTGADFYAGPSLSFGRTLRGNGPAFNRLLSLDAKVQFRSHAYEQYAGSPRAGYSVIFSGGVNDRHLASSFSAQRLAIRGEYLWNYRNYDPPLFIVGTRFSYATVFPGQGGWVSLPVDYLQYLGGSTSVRGFGLLELPQLTANGVKPPGHLTSIYGGIELRLSNTLPFSLDPFVFFDVGALGLEAFYLSSPLFASPGFGLRWASPIGPVRTTLAHGMGALNNHPQFFINLGEEF